MGVLYIVGGIGLVILFFLLVTGPVNQKHYHCSKCGFETYSELEAAGHEKLENAHRMLM